MGHSYPHIRFFLGFHLTPLLRSRIGSSKLQKGYLASLGPLQQTTHQNEELLGIYFDEGKTSLPPQELKGAMEQLKVALQQLTPELNFEGLPLYVIAQTVIL